MDFGFLTVWEGLALDGSVSAGAEPDGLEGERDPGVEDITGVRVERVDSCPIYTVWTIR